MYISSILFFNIYILDYMSNDFALLRLFLIGQNNYVLIAFLLFQTIKNNFVTTYWDSIKPKLYGTDFMPVIAFL